MDFDRSMSMQDQSRVYSNFYSSRVDSEMESNYNGEMEPHQLSDDDGGIETLMDARDTSKAKRTKKQREKTEKAVQQNKVGGKMCGAKNDKACCLLF